MGRSCCSNVVKFTLVRTARCSTINTTNVEGWEQWESHYYSISSYRYLLYLVTINSDKLKSASAGPVWREKKEKKQISHEAVDTQQEHTTATKRSTHPLTAVQQNVVQQQWRPRSDPSTHHVLQQYSKWRTMQRLITRLSSPDVLAFAVFIAALSGDRPSRLRTHLLMGWVR